MLLRMLISSLVLLLPAAAQPVAAVLVCPAANQPLEDPATMAWKSGNNTPSYRLLLGPTAGSSRDGDTSLISGLTGQLAGLPPGQNLYITLWSYDQNGNPVEPPSSCAIKTAQRQPTVDFKDTPGTTLTGVSLGSFAVETQACQEQCKQNSGCQGYTYYPAGNGNPAAMCDLKSQITATAPSECCLSALKTVTPAAPIPTNSVPAPSASPVTTAPIPGPARPATTLSATPAPAPAGAPAIKSVSGDWVNQLGAVSRIVQKGGNITGTYSDPKQRSLTGTLQGTFDGKTLRATLNWKSGADSSSGSLLLTVTPQGGLDGTWTDAAGVVGPWSMGPAKSGRGTR